ncbi:MAG: hypothetical protein JNM94_09020 [Phycisphaerae bacterium]|nr:hypothetical protein [Phycisphaerae bacterium]
MLTRLLVGVLAPCLAIGTASAAVVNVTILGTVEFAPNSGPLGPINPNQAAKITFSVDSSNFVNNPTFPTRGYPITQPTFSTTMGPITMTLKNPFPGTPYFVIRNNDPQVDGFQLSTDLSLPVPPALNLNGSFGPYGAGFYVTYEGNTLPSLDILDAIGTYEYDGLTVFYWNITDGPFEAVGMIFESITLSVSADLNADGIVNGADLGILLGAWGPCRSCANCTADLNGDCTVDGADLGILLGAWSL